MNPDHEALILKYLRRVSPRPGVEADAAVPSNPERAALLETEPSCPEALEPDYFATTHAFTLSCLPDAQDPTRDLRTIVADPSFSPRFRFQSPDGTIPTSDSPEVAKLDAVVVQIPADPAPASASPDTLSPLSPQWQVGLAGSGNGAYARLDPYAAGKIAISEAARNLACIGARPLCTRTSLGLSDIPQTAESAWQRREFARGIADGALAFNAPASTGEPLFSRAGPAASPGFTPAVTMAGLISQNSPIPTPWFKDAGDAIFLLGDLMDPEDPLLGLGGSAVLRLVHRLDTGLPPVCDFQKERELHLALRAFICSGVVKSAHDCAEGGLAIALLESCALRPSSQPAAEALGAQVDLTHLTTSTAPDAASAPAGTHPSPSPTGRLDAWLFGEAQARVIISVAPLDAGKVLPQAAILGIPAARIGVAGGTSLEIKTPRGTLNCPIAEIARFPNKPPELDLPESGS